MTHLKTETKSNSEMVHWNKDLDLQIVEAAYDTKQ